MDAHITPVGTALVTGASTGIGAAYADRLARRSHSLVLVARDGARLAALAERLGVQHGVRAEVLQADLTTPAELARVEERLRGDPDIAMLVNNAGMSVAGGFLSTDIDRVEAMVRLNVLAPTRLAQAAAAGFAARGRGTIINIASVLALAPEMFGGAYSATKAYMLNLSRSLQTELAPRGVRVQAVLPGATRTEIWERSGMSVDALPAHAVMEVGTLVDAALAGLDGGEDVTIPALEDAALWQAFEDARHALAPHLSLREAATRYHTAAA
ncbi:MAG TPA: SDR family oxidoreductase [Burkholderiaceae bacterium]